MKRIRTKQLFRSAACLLCLIALCASGYALAEQQTIETIYDDLLRQEQAGAAPGAGGGASMPTCDGPPGCAHFSVSENGALTGLCALGRWLVTADALGMDLRSSAPEELTLTGGDNYIYRSATYQLSGGGVNTHLIVLPGKSPVLLAGSAQVGKLTLMSGASVTLSPGASINTLDATDGRLNLYGEQRFNTVNGSLTLAGDGTLRVDALNAALSVASSGNCRVVYKNAAPAAIQNWKKIDAPSSPSQQYFTEALLRAVYDGNAIPLCFANSAKEAYVPLDIKETYKIAFNAANECVVTLNPQKKQYVLSNSPTPLAATADGVLSGSGTQDVTASGGISLEVTNAHGGDFAVHPGSTVKLTLHGSNSFSSLTAAGAGAVIGGTGALSVQSVQGGVQLNPQTNVSVATNPGEINGKKPTRIRITENEGQPVANTRLLLNIGASESFVTTTDKNGCITLWRDAKLTAVSAVVLSGGGSYAAVLTDGSAEADALPVITSLTSDNQGNVTVRAANAQTLGLQYVVDSVGRDLRDAFDVSAAILYAPDGRFTIPGLKSGDVVTFRAFAAKDAGITLNDKTTDAFVFSQKRTIISFTLGNQHKVYDGEPFRLSPKKVPKEWDVKYYNEKNQAQEIPAPSSEGSYIIKITVPHSDPAVTAGTYAVNLTISRKRILVYPLGDMKIKGERDPMMMFFTDPLVGNDQPSGRLRRMKGEGYGNYPYYADQVSAVDENGKEVYHYYFVIAPDSPYFFIDWNWHHYMPLDPLSIIDPVYDELHFSDGRTLKVQSRTSEILRLGGSYFGTLAIDTDTREARPFIPSLRLKKGKDEALIILTTDAELRKDGGYQTDRDGARQWGSRTLILSDSQINKFKRQNVYDIAFSLKGTTLLLSMNDLTSEAMNQTLRANGLTRSNTRFCFELTPVENTDALTDGEAGASAALAERQPMMRVNAYLENGTVRLDISNVLPSAQLLFDAGDLLVAEEKTKTPDDVTETVNGRPVQQEPKSTDESVKEDDAIRALTGKSDDAALLDLGYRLLEDAILREGYALRGYHGDSRADLDSAIVAPYTASEANAMDYAALMRIRPFLITDFRQSGLYGLTR